MLVCPDLAQTRIPSVRYSSDSLSVNLTLSISYTNTSFHLYFTNPEDIFPGFLNFNFITTDDPLKSCFRDAISYVTTSSLKGCNSTEKVLFVTWVQS